MRIEEPLRVRIGPALDVPLDRRRLVEPVVHGPETGPVGLGEDVQPDDAVPDRHPEDVAGPVVAHQVQRHGQLQEVAVAVGPVGQDRLDEAGQFVRLAGRRGTQPEDRLALVLDATLEGEPPAGTGRDREGGIAGHLVGGYGPFLFNFAGVPSGMCGRYSLFAPAGDIEDRFGATFDGAFEPRYNAAPRQSLPVVPDEDPGTLTAMEWGFVPPWADDRADFGFINARAETLTGKPTFREAFRAGTGDDGDATGGDGLRAGRCLVPADGFYEWVESDGGKQPYRVRLADDGLFAMAGLWAEYQPERTQTGLGDFAGGTAAGTGTGPETLRTYAIVTTEPNGLVAELHNRMSVILPRGEEHRWLREDSAEVADLLEPYPAESMCADPVSRAVNDPSNDSPAVLEAGDTDSLRARQSADPHALDES